MRDVVCVCGGGGGGLSTGKLLEDKDTGLVNRQSGPRIFFNLFIFYFLFIFLKFVIYSFFFFFFFGRGGGRGNVGTNVDIVTIFSNRTMSKPKTFWAILFYNKSKTLEGF